MNYAPSSGPTFPLPDCGPYQVEITWSAIRRPVAPDSHQVTHPQHERPTFDPVRQGLTRAFPRLVEIDTAQTVSRHIPVRKAASATRTVAPCRFAASAACLLLASCSKADEPAAQGRDSTARESTAPPTSSGAHVSKAVCVRLPRICAEFINKIRMRTSSTGARYLPASFPPAISLR